MTDPVLHVVAGPDGAGRSTYVDLVLEPVVGLPFVNADRIAAAEWPGEELQHAYDASAAAAAVRERLLAARRSFITETVFSHESKVVLVQAASSAGYLVHLHVLVVPVDLSVARVAQRVDEGGHDVPEDKIRQRHARLWDLVVTAAAIAMQTRVFGSTGPRFDLIAHLRFGRPVTGSQWPSWTPDPLRRLGTSPDSDRP